nr:RNA-dependent RNA polymerase [Totiviridae sp.]
MKHPESLRPRPRGLVSLRRFFRLPPPFWPVNKNVSSSWGLYLLYKYIKHIGQVHLAEEFLGMMSHISRMSDEYFLKVDNLDKALERSEWEDDYYRQVLKQLSGYCFPLVFSRGPAYMFLVHLHSLTGKAPYTQEQIVEDIKVWVSNKKPDGGFKQIDADTTKKVLDDVFGKWYKGEPEGHLTFKEFCNDFIRWGTSGGARKVEIDEEKYRTKWALGYTLATDKGGNLREDYDVYASVCKGDDNTSKIALKEEAQKTREIITTPMPSYLRQAYLMYRWGKPKLPSPISSPNWVAHFETSSHAWYGCIDGDKFDQTIPASFVLDVVQRLGQLDEETREVAAREIESLQTLHVQWKDVKYKWEGGILSGWRLTSILGTLASAVAARYIIERSGATGAVEYGALGDDLVLFSYSSSIPQDIMVALYNEFGLVANKFKTTSGAQGEFLRKVVSVSGSWGYPAMALHSLIYANPWISSYQFEREVEMSGSWLTFVSRLLPHAVEEVGFDILSDCLLNLEESFGPGRWKDWLKTPISAGGGGSIEFTDFSRWTRLEHRVKSSRYFTDRLRVIPTMVGIFKAKLVFERTPSFPVIDLNQAMDDAKELRSLPQSYSTGFKHGVNITKTLYAFLNYKINRSGLNTFLRAPIPRSIRGNDVVKIVQFLMMGGDKSGAYTSICHTKEMMSLNSTLTKFIHRAVSISRRFSQTNILKPAITLYFLVTYQHHQIPTGTW